jgi:hypothetical protein
MSFLDDLATAEARGAQGQVGIAWGGCSCDICRYRFGNHKLDEENHV